MSKFLSGLAFGLALFANQAAQAAPILDFGVIAPNPPTASISYAGGASPLVGTGIAVDEVVGLGTPLNSGVVRALTSGLLTFTTGPLLAFIPGTAMPPSPDLWEFDGGGPITITGDDGLGPGDRTLLSGTILGATVVAPLPGGAFKVAVAAFFNTVDATLAAYYGLTGGEDAPYSGIFNLQFNATTLADKSFTSSIVLSGDITTSPAPEPGTLALAGMAVVGGVVWRRRRGRAFEAA